jgi:hypothetical protein
VESDERWKLLSAAGKICADSKEERRCESAWCANGGRSSCTNSSETCDGTSFASPCSTRTHTDIGQGDLRWMLSVRFAKGAGDIEGLAGSQIGNSYKVSAFRTENATQAAINSSGDGLASTRPGALLAKSRNLSRL